MCDSIDLTPLRIARAKFMMESDNGFLSAILMGLEIGSMTAGYACVNSNGFLLVQMDWFITLSDDVKAFVIYHELGHILRDHFQRSGTRDPMVWNYAGDFVINQDAVDNGYTIWEHALYDPVYEGMSTEQVYDILAGPSGNTGIDNKGWNDVTEHVDAVDGMSGAGDSIRQLVHDAILAHPKAAGKQLGEEVVNHHLKMEDPKVDWLAMLEQHASEFFPDRFTYAKINYQLNDYGVIKPTLAGSTLKHVVIAVDFSYSMKDHLNKCLVEVVGVMQAFEDIKVTLLVFDSEIRMQVDVAEIQELVKRKFVGLGGTALDPVIKRMNQIRGDLLVVLSDMEAAPAYVKPKFECIWCQFGDYEHTPRFGELIKIPEDG